MKKIITVVIIIVGLIFLSFKMNDNSMKKLEVGDKVPSFKLNDQNGNAFTVNSLIGKPMVIYFYPKDDTPGCVKEACKFRDDFEDFLKLETLVIGISADNVESHKKFEEKYNLPFTLLADVKNEVRKLFGVSKSAMGMIPGRVTYIIDAEGVIQYIFDDMMHAEKHIAVALDFLRG